MTFPAYSEYKDSGVEWLGQLPAQWRVARLKRLLSQPLQYGANEAADDDTPGQPRFVRITDICSDGSLHEETFRSLPEAVAAPYLLEEGDVLLARSGATVGKSFIYRRSWGVCCFAGYLIRARVNALQMLPSYLYLCCQADFYWQYIAREQIQATIQNVSAERYGSLFLPAPPIPEQRAISTFLDRETGKIDTLVAEQEKLIDLLKEKRQAVISHAVTKGLDPSVPMKDSGVAWLGEVPEHWEVVALGAVALAIQTGPFGSQLHAEDYVEDHVPVINPANIQDEKIVPNWSNTILPTVRDRLSEYALCRGDVIVGRRGEMGRCAVVEECEVGWLCGTGSLIVRLSERGLPRFVAMFIRTSYVREWLALQSVGSTMNNLNAGILSRLKVLLPPLNEQEEILNYIAKQVGWLDSLTTEAGRNIELLKERRSALISAAVTGKIDVRGLVDDLPTSEEMEPA